MVIRSIIYGILASLLLLLIYFVIMSLGGGSFSYAYQELTRQFDLISLLILGFGINIGLYTYARDCHRVGGAETGSAAAGGATSTIAMIACCAHHVTDILPLVGLTVAATFLVQYQSWFLGLGIISNLVGIALMIRQIRKIKHE